MLALGMMAMAVTSRSASALVLSGNRVRALPFQRSVAVAMSSEGGRSSAAVAQVEKKKEGKQEKLDLTPPRGTKRIAAAIRIKIGTMLRS